MIAVQQFADLFAGNATAYGSDTGSAIHYPPTLKVYERHLEGIEPIGIYPCIQQPDNRLTATSDGLWVKWGCCDIDTGDWNEVWALWSALKAMGIAATIERSRSKGWHVWIFSAEWVPAATMRRALKCAYKAIDLPAREANPKSEHLRPYQLGNYVRLPYKGIGSFFNQRLDRQIVMEGFDRNGDGHPVPFATFLANVETVSQETLTKWAAKWYEPPRHNIGITPDDALKDEALKAVVARLPYTLGLLWTSGPKQEHKRSEGLVALAYQTAAKGFTAQEVYSLVSSADRIWGKYSSRPNGQDYLLDIVERAFK